MVKDTYVDGILVHWAEELLRGRVKAKKGRVRDMLKAPKVASGGRTSSYSPMSPDSARQRLRDTFSKVPEVNVKITGSGKHMAQIKAHIDYISRNGQRDLEDQDGKLVSGRDELLDLRDAWRDGRHVIPDAVGTKRESFNIVLSMPPGTDRLSVHNAVRDFARSEFGGRYDYAFVSHDDTDHPHAHLAVKAQGYDSRRLDPRKSDLQRWRQTFAEKLREHGIEANATTRRTRGITKKPKGRGVIEAEKAGRELPRYRDANDNPSNPYAHKTRQTHGQVLRAYKGIAEALQQSSNEEDRRLAIDLVKFVGSMPIERELIRNQVRAPTPERDRDTRANQIQTPPPKDMERGE
jgi:hypothetical protein